MVITVVMLLILLGTSLQDYSLTVQDGAQRFLRKCNNLICICAHL